MPGSSEGVLAWGASLLGVIDATVVACGVGAMPSIKLNGFSCPPHMVEEFFEAMRYQYDGMAAAMYLVADYTRPPALLEPSRSAGRFGTTNKVWNKMLEWVRLNDQLRFIDALPPMLLDASLGHPQ